MTTAEAVTGQSGFAQVLLQLQDPAENWVSQLSVCRLPDDRQHKRNGSYQSVYAKFMSYHQLNDSLVLAGELSGCTKDGQIPLWDTCRLSLRGFPVTDYLSKKSIQAQVEARWRFYKRWGLVAFAGAGWVDDSFGNHGEDKTIPSYGVGIRWMVLESQRINVRVDFARSDNGSSAVYLGVTEAF